MRLIEIAAASAVYLVSMEASLAEEVSVKYRGDIDLSNYDCSDITRSSFINRVCYNDEAAGVEFIPENGGGAGVRLRTAGGI